MKLIATLLLAHVCVFVGTEVFVYFDFTYPSHFSEAQIEKDYNYVRIITHQPVQLYYTLFELLGLFVYFVVVPAIRAGLRWFRDKERIRLTQLLQAGAISADEFDKRMSRLSG